MPSFALSAETVCRLTALWPLVFGAAVGSFLNVVIYRLPVGKSVVTPGSRCPTCNRPIRWFDNVPILSWIVLRGRCRYCQAKIALRYPAVEAGTAALFVLLCAVECLSGGANLPPRTQCLPEVAAVAGWSLPQLLGICLFHLVLGCTLLSVVLIEYDGGQPPSRLFVPAWIVGVLSPLAWPHLHPVSAGLAMHGWLAGATDSGTGLAAGLVSGWLASRTCAANRRSGLWMCLATVGLLLGWQAVVALTLVTVAVDRVLATMGRAAWWRRIPPTAWLAGATLMWILAWARLTALLPALG